MLEFDDHDAIIEPYMTIKKIPHLPKTAVLCFSKRMIDTMALHLQLPTIGELSSANGSIPIYEYERETRKILLIMARVGASACVVELEELDAMGVEQVVMLGSAGVLSKDIISHHIIIPVSAIRDEGTSDHYRKPEPQIPMDPACVAILEELLQTHHIPYKKGITWTTDAPYRETKKIVAQRIQEGCICVEMECSACMAVSAFRHKRFFPLLYAADHVGLSSWNPRVLLDHSSLDDRMKLLDLIITIAISIAS